MAGPSWALILSYEHALRKRMVYYVQKGHTVKTALKAAQDDPVTKERYFTTPLRVKSVSRKRPPPQVLSQPRAGFSPVVFALVGSFRTI